MEVLEKHYLECINQHSNKFYEIQILAELNEIFANSTSVYYALKTRYGSIGTNGTINVKQYSTLVQCQSEVLKLYKQKIGKGYMLIDSFAPSSIEENIQKKPVETKEKKKTIKKEKKQDIQSSLLNRLNNLEFED